MKKSIKQKQRGMMVLPIKKKWFDMIISGEKKEEYRLIKKHYHARFGNYFINHKLFAEQRRILEKMDTVEKKIIFRNGYRYDDPQVICSCKLSVGMGKEKWGAQPGIKYYILKIIEIIEVQNINKGEEEECRLLEEKDIVVKQQN